MSKAPRPQAFATADFPKSFVSDTQLPAMFATADRARGLASASQPSGKSTDMRETLPFIAPLAGGE
jgi:hypothetical protein